VLVSDPTPEVDDLLPFVVSAASSAQLAAPDKILGERLADGLNAAADVPLNTQAV
jgi:hypothetical protein